MTNRFERTRADHRHELAEDYLELIAALIEERGEARAVELAERLGVSHVSVSKTVSRLRRDGYVTAEPYRAIFLTDLGREVAASAKERHMLVHNFLLAIGVADPNAEIDAEGMEHHCSQETLAAMRRFLKK